MQDLPTTTTTLIEALQANQSTGWKRFREHYVPFIFAIAMQNTSNRDEAGQVTQIIVSKIAEQMPTFERERHGERGEKRATFRGFIKTICYRQINNFYRQRHRDARKLDPKLFDKRYSELELRHAITIAKQNSKRSASSWELFHMRFEQKLSVAEIAAAKKLNRETVQKTIRRAVLAIQKVLNGD